LGANINKKAVTKAAALEEYGERMPSNGQEGQAGKAGIDFLLSSWRTGSIHQRPGYHFSTSYRWPLRARPLASFYLAWPLLPGRFQNKRK
jgi:hypothetical protein